MGYSVESKTDVKLDKDVLNKILAERQWTYIELLHRIQQKYGIKIKYKGFMTLLHNQPSWKLLYAYAIADILEVKIEDLFVMFMPQEISAE